MNDKHQTINRIMQRVDQYQSSDKSDLIRDLFTYFIDKHTVELIEQDIANKQSIVSKNQSSNV